jgi:hypothetical protein
VLLARHLGPPPVQTHTSGRTTSEGEDQYRKEEPTFSDALAAVRRSIWADAARFPTPPRAGDRVEVARTVLDRLTDLACHSA